MKKYNESHIEVAVYQQAKDENVYCGDSYFYVETKDRFFCALADGLGSGKPAYESAQAAIETIKSNLDCSIDEIIKKCSEQLVGKRGVVLGIFILDYHTKQYNFYSIGNISMMSSVAGKRKKRHIPNAGYLAGYTRSYKVTNDILEDNMNIIIFSDGIEDHNVVKKSLICTNVQDITRAFENKEKNDDATLIAIRYEEKEMLPNYL
ncbi:indirect negative regulator of sigma-B activity [Virgibacillus soli]|uniref:Indirect negative regulator of sigma-B activity n=1 Tax=Paracerasibacillus soli TaxID=480284 RepID=A0ABU5CVQ7_9BACI|nr:indirect negative regulator of sigma-B activity [Virgibacillus soli]MDY0410460.1 indirect negative regulator of sigma-B activity [Virgibacillus soli]